MTQNTTNNMMDNYFNSDPTDFEETPFHLITTDHPYMATLGLSTFTTGTLYRWWNKKDGQGDYKNHRHFSGTSFSPVPRDLLLGTDTASNTDKSSDIGKGQFAFQAWRKQGDSGAGQYLDSYADGGHTETWTFSQAGNNEANKPRSYTYSDLNLAEYDNTFFNSDMSLGDEFEHPDGQGGQEMVSFIGIEPITNIIALNDYVNKLEIDTIDKSTWSQEQFARVEFILDIQASKGGYVEWSGYVPFQINLHDGDDTEVKCDKPEWVKHRLYLHPNSAPRSTRRGIAMAKPTFAAPPVDSLGRKYQFKEDGRFSAFPEGSKVAEVAGELDMSFNEYTGKWEAGSKQMVGVVTQTIEAAQVMSVARLRNLKPEEMLRNPQDPNSHIIWGSGGAFPLNMQNGNPMQWTPNYAQSSEVDENGKFAILCPESSDEKASLRVFNASSKALEVDQYVLLNQIEGLWFAIDFPSGIPSDGSTEAGFDGLWDFSYFATNVVHYFKDKWFNLVRPGQVEKGLHSAYYTHDTLNRGTYSDQNWVISQQLQEGGYHQFSSFDMMDNLMGGTRTGINAYGITNPVEGPNGETVEGPTNGYSTGTFFGCLFPDGYKSEEIVQFRADRTFIGMPTIALSGENSTALGNKWQSASPRVTVGPVEYQYFHDGGIAKDGRPFNDGLARHDYSRGFTDPGNGDLVPMFSDSDTSLSQLPADIALNASPFNPKNGQPLTNLHMIGEIYKTATGVVSGQEGWLFKERVRSLFSDGKNWLYKKYDDDDDMTGIKDFTESSCFDFQPVRPNRIMFRPLKVEAYSQFGVIQYKSGLPNDKQYDRQYFGQIAASTMTSRKRPASDISRLRELNNDKLRTSIGNAATPFTLPGVFGNIHHLYNEHWGLQLNVDIPPRPSTYTPGFASYPRFGTNPRAFIIKTSRFHQNAWGFIENRNSWMHGRPKEENDGNNFAWKSQLGTPQPAGAVGVIGAVATCTANSKIHFESTCKLGIWSYNFSVTAEAVRQQPSWGAQDRYDSFMTTNLFVKVYHAWPREQTIYDPRFYAVHHFNPGILDETTTADPESFKIETVEEDISHKDPVTGAVKNYKYLIEQSKYETASDEGIDIRVPCSKQQFNLLNPLGTNLPTLLLSESKIYGTNVIDETGLVLEALPKSKWLLNTKRRAKLLPYKYLVEQVMIPKIKVTLPSFSAGLDADGNDEKYKNGGYAIVRTGPLDADGFFPVKVVPFFDSSKPVGSQFTTFDPLTKQDTEDVLMVIKNPGNGPSAKYKRGDTFVTPASLGSQAMIKITNVEGGLAAVEGMVESFEVVLQGYDFDSTGFTAVELDRPVSKTSMGMSLSGGGSQPPSDGLGFNCFVVRGVVDLHSDTDFKPELATASDDNRISIKSEKGDESEGGAPIFGLNQDTYDLDVEIETKSLDNKYDLFFHFHNDISMTFMTNQNKVGAHGPFVNDEQYIDLTITTT